MTGPVGTPCPVCGHYLNVFGCRPGACKDPERAEGGEAPTLIKRPGDLGLSYAPRGHTIGKVAADFWQAAANVIPPTHFAGVPIEEFCATDRARIEQMFREGKIGIAGMCASCSAKVDAATPAAQAPDGPPPWKWRGDGLVDANGRAVIEIETYHDSPTITFASDRVKALTEAAPEMEALLREWYSEYAVQLAQPDPEELLKLVGTTQQLLARLDAASKG